MEHVITTPDDLAEVEDPQAALETLDEQLAPVWQARQPLATLANAVTETDYINNNVNDALGRVAGALWRRPLGGHDAYPNGAEVTHNGRAFTNTIPANVWEPGVHGWTDDGSAGDIPDPPAAEPWSDEGVAYKPGDHVTFNGETYACVQAHTSQAGWTPAAVPALWTAIA